jgi:hypothetical protein
VLLYFIEKKTEWLLLVSQAKTDGQGRLIDSFRTTSKGQMLKELLFPPTINNTVYQDFETTNAVTWDVIVIKESCR